MKKHHTIILWLSGPFDFHSFIRHIQYLSVRKSWNFKLFTENYSLQWAVNLYFVSESNSRNGSVKFEPTRVNKSQIWNLSHFLTKCYCMAWNTSHINCFYVMFIVLFCYFGARQSQSFNFIEKKQWVSKCSERKSLVWKNTWVHKRCHNFFSFLSTLFLSLMDSLNRECLSI